MYVDDELKKLLTEENGEVEVLYLLIEGRDCEWYVLLYVLYPFVKKRRVRMIYMCIYVAFTYRKKGRANSTRLLIFGTHSSKEGECEWCTCAVYM